MQAFGNDMKTLLNKEYDRNKIIEQMTKEVFTLPISAQGTFDPQISQITRIEKQKMILKPACHCKARAGRYCG